MMTGEKDSGQNKNNEMFTPKQNSNERPFQMKHDSVQKGTCLSDRSMIKKPNSIQRRQPEKNEAADVTESRLRGLKGSKLELRITSLRARTSDLNKHDGLLLLPEKCTEQTAQHSILPDPDITSAICNKEMLHENAEKEAVDAAGSLLKHVKVQDGNFRQTHCGFGKTAGNHLHQIKGNRNNQKQTIRTALVYLGLEAVQIDNRKHREVFRPQLTDPLHTFYQHRSSNEDNVRESTADDNDGCYSPEVQGNSTLKKDSLLDNVEDSKRTLVSVMPLIFTPPSNHKVRASYSISKDSDMTSRKSSTISNNKLINYMPDSQMARNLASHSSNDATNRGKQKKEISTITQVKTVHLEVFSERREMKLQQHITVGRISSSLAMPAYK